MSLSNQLSFYQPHLVALTTVLVVWLCYKCKQRDGFESNPYANTLGFESLASSGYAGDVPAYVGREMQRDIKELQGKNVAGVSGMTGGYEPPVFWNAGDYSDIANQQASAMEGFAGAWDSQKVSRYSDTRYKEGMAPSGVVRGQSLNPY